MINLHQHHPKGILIFVIRQSYIDEIMVEAKRRPIPGPGKYNPEKTLDEVKKEVDEMKKKKIKPTERPTYLNEY